MSAKDLLDTIQSRASVTKYEDRGVERDKIGKLLEAARWVPSAGNMQSLEYVIVDDHDIKESLARHAYNQDHIRDAPVCIVILGDAGKAAAKYDDRGEERYMVQESGAAMQNILLMAEELGLGAAWVGAFDDEKVSTELDVPDELVPLAMVTVGYPRERPEPSNKYRITDMTYMNTYGTRIHAIYDKIVWQGFREYGRKAKNALKRKLKNR